MLICILTKNVITSCSVTMMLFLHLEVKPLMTLTTVLYLSCALDRKSGSAGMPRPISYAVFCLKKQIALVDGFLLAAIDLNRGRDGARQIARKNLRLSS